MLIALPGNVRANKCIRIIWSDLFSTEVTQTACRSSIPYCLQAPLAALAWFSVPAFEYVLQKFYELILYLPYSILCQFFVTEFFFTCGQTSSNRCMDISFFVWVWISSNSLKPLTTSWIVEFIYLNFSKAFDRFLMRVLYPK